MDRLPAAVRLQIFKHAGLYHGQKILLNPQKFWSQWPDPSRLSASLALMKVCRYFYDEVIQAFYSENVLVLRVTSPQDLAILHNLRPAAIRALRHLAVHLNTTSCLLPDRLIEGTEFDDHVHTTPLLCPRFVPRDRPFVPPTVPLSSPLSLDDAPQRELAEQWVIIMTDLLSQAVPNQLGLHLICDCLDVKAAHLVTGPLRNTAVALSDCSVRLAPKPSKALSALSEQTALSAMHKPQRQTAFPFFSLPYEIQLRVMELTDLVLPGTEAEWSFNYGFRVTISQYCHEGCSRHDPDHACRWKSCYKRLNNACFCSRYHAAWSSQCRCWVPPTSYFLVSRSFYDLSKCVFYSKNRFIISPYEKWAEVPSMNPSRINAEIFLLDVVGPRFLRHLRFLDILFPIFAEDYMKMEDPCFGGWLDAVEALASNSSLPNLTLQVHMASHMRDHENMTYDHPGWCKRTDTEVETLLKAYHRIIEPLQWLRGLKAFFIYAHWPFGARQAVDNYQRHILQKEDTLALEMLLERGVMGPSYDSTVAGKPPRHRCFWRSHVERVKDSMSAGEVQDHIVFPEWYELTADFDYLEDLGPFNRPPQ